MKRSRFVRLPYNRPPRVADGGAHIWPPASFTGARALDLAGKLYDWDHAQCLEARAGANGVCDTADDEPERAGEQHEFSYINHPIPIAHRDFRVKWT